MTGTVGSLADQLVLAASEGDEDEFAELFDKLGEKDKSKLIHLLGGGGGTPAGDSAGSSRGNLRETPSALVTSSMNTTANRSALQQSQGVQESPTTAFWGGASGSSAASGVGEGLGSDGTDGGELQSMLKGLDLDDLDSVVNSVA
jgi:hypothetical protein